MRWPQRLLGKAGPSQTAPTASQPDSAAQVTGSVLLAESPRVEDLDAFVAAYVRDFRVTDWAGDQRDQRLLERVRDAVGDRGDGQVLKVLLKGLNLTGDQPRDHFPKASFMKALGELGNPQAVGSLRAIRLTSGFEPTRKAAAEALSCLGDGSWVEERENLEARAKELIKQRTGENDRRILSDHTLLNAAALLERDGDFIAECEYDKHKYFFGRAVVVKAINR